MTGRWRTRLALLERHQAARQRHRPAEAESPPSVGEVIGFLACMAACSGPAVMEAHVRSASLRPALQHDIITAVEQLWSWTQRRHAELVAAYASGEQSVEPGAGAQGHPIDQLTAELAPHAGRTGRALAGWAAQARVKGTMGR